jgi:hypothetical protein
MSEEKIDLLNLTQVQLLLSLANFDKLALFQRYSYYSCCSPAATNKLGCAYLNRESSALLNFELLSSYYFVI